MWHRAQPASIHDQKWYSAHNQYILVSTIFYVLCKFSIQIVRSFTITLYSIIYSCAGVCVFFSLLYQKLEVIWARDLLQCLAWFVLLLPTLLFYIPILFCVLVCQPTPKNWHSHVSQFFTVYNLVGFLSYRMESKELSSPCYPVRNPSTVRKTFCNLFDKKLTVWESMLRLISTCCMECCYFMIICLSHSLTLHSFYTSILYQSLLP